MKNFFAFICSIIALGLSICCFLLFLSTQNMETTINTNFTSSEFLNNIAKSVFIFLENTNILKVVGIGLLTVLFDIHFSETMNEFYQKLPLGCISDDIDDKGKFKKFILNTSPSLFISLYGLIYWGVSDYSPSSIDFCNKWILPVALICSIISAIILVCSIIKYGGLWGFIVRVPLLIAGNLYLISVTTLLLLLIAEFIVGTTVSIVASIIGLKCLFSRRRDWLYDRKVV